MDGSGTGTTLERVRAARQVIRDVRVTANMPSASVVTAGNGTADLLDAGKLGLVGIQERVRLVGCRVELRTWAGEGTTVDVAAPIDSR